MYANKVEYAKAKMTKDLTDLQNSFPEMVINSTMVTNIIARGCDCGLTITWNDGKEAMYSQLTIKE